MPVWDINFSTTLSNNPSSYVKRMVRLRELLNRREIAEVLLPTARLFELLGGNALAKPASTPRPNVPNISRASWDVLECLGHFMDVRCFFVRKAMQLNRTQLMPNRPAYQTLGLIVANPGCGKP